MILVDPCNKPIGSYYTFPYDALLRQLSCLKYTEFRAADTLNLLLLYGHNKDKSPNSLRAR